MNKKVLFVLALSWILASCVSQDPLFVGSQVGDRTLGISGCEPYKGTMPECTGDENEPKVTIYVDTLVVDPMCIKAKKGKKIEFTLKSESGSDIERGSVVIFPKKIENFWWLTGSNWQNKNKIKIRIPIEEISGTPFPTDEKPEYGVLTSYGCIDPRINVVD